MKKTFPLIIPVTLRKIIFWTCAGMLTFLLMGFSIMYLYRDRLIKATIKELNKYIVSKVEVSEKIEVSFIEKWPEVSLMFQNVNVYENSISGTEKLAHAGKLFFFF